MAIYIARATIDSHMNGVGADKDTNYGASGSVEMGVVIVGGEKNKLMRAIGNFDVSALSGRTITSAQLERKYTGFSDGTSSWAVTIYRCTRPSTWTEGGVTWNKYDGTNSWTTAGGDYDGSTPTPVSYTEPATMLLTPITRLKDFVIDALNNRSGVVSLIMRADVENPANTRWVAWRSREYEGGGVWLLRIEHSGAPIGARRERGFLRGVLRGVMRGGA